jgi:hypothetical protein
MLLANMRVAKLISDAFPEHALLRCKGGGGRASLRCVLVCARASSVRVHAGVHKHKHACNTGIVQHTMKCNPPPTSASQASPPKTPPKTPAKTPETPPPPGRCHPFPNERKLRELQVAAKELGVELDVTSAGGGAWRLCLLALWGAFDGLLGCGWWGGCVCSAWGFLLRFLGLTYR